MGNAVSMPSATAIYSQLQTTGRVAAADRRLPYRSPPQTYYRQVGFLLQAPVADGLAAALRRLKRRQPHAAAPAQRSNVSSLHRDLPGAEPFGSWIGPAIAAAALSHAPAAAAHPHRHPQVADPEATPRHQHGCSSSHPAGAGSAGGLCRPGHC